MKARSARRGQSSDLAHASLRLTVGAATTSSDIDRVLELAPEAALAA